jgi:hypothetical protein
MRSEMASLLATEPSFGKFDPQDVQRGVSGDNVPIASLTNTSWIDDRLRGAWDALLTKAPKFTTFMNKILARQVSPYIPSLNL